MKQKMRLVCALCCAVGTVTAFGEEPPRRRDEIMEPYNPAAESIAEPSAAESTVAPTVPEKPVTAPVAPDGAVSVPYIPEPVKEQIKKEIREELRKEVTEDVVRHARKQRWGVSDAWPEWVRRMEWAGDLRLRAQVDDFSKDNAPNIPDAQRINETRTPDPSLNATEDRDRLRTRLRVGARANVAEGYDIGFRVATGNSADPVSTNQTLGNTNRPYSILVERAFLRYQVPSRTVTVWGGRMPNPWFGTDLVWDDDLAFDGFALKVRPLLRLEDSDYREFDPFVTLGIFPIQEVELSTKDKWLYGAQVGFNWKVSGNSRLSFGLGYYDYRNIEGEANGLSSDLNNFTAPQFVQKGNTMFLLSDPLLNGRPTLFGLASDYNQLNVTASLALINFAPTQIILTADYVKNLGFDREKVEARSSNNLLIGPLEEDTWGTQFRITVGRPVIEREQDWQVFAAYKRLGRDAVLDAFTDSDFHLGGTDAKGWILGGGYGLNDGVSLGFRILSSSEIKGPPFSVDTFQFDLNARF